MNFTDKLQNRGFVLQNPILSLSNILPSWGPCDLPFFYETVDKLRYLYSYYCFVCSFVRLCVCVGEWVGRCVGVCVGVCVGGGCVCVGVCVWVCVGVCGCVCVLTLVVLYEFDGCSLVFAACLVKYCGDEK